MYVWNFFDGVFGKIPISAMRFLQYYDIIFVSYGTLIVTPSAMGHSSWYRVVFDESHTVRRVDSPTYRVCMQLDTPRALCMTATPCFDTLGDILPQIRMTGVSAADVQFLRPRTTTKKLDSPRFPHDCVLFIGPANGNVVRKIVYTRLSPVERALYNRVKRSLDVRRANASFKTRVLAAACLSLRILTEFDTDVHVSDSESEELGHCSTKMSKLIQLVNTRATGPKPIVFFNTTRLLQAACTDVADRFDRQLYVAHSRHRIRHRFEVIQAFKESDSAILFVSVRVAGTCLNLNFATDIIFMEVSGSASVMSQAEGRVRRMDNAPGQTSTIWYIVAENTHEHLAFKRLNLDTVI